MRPHVWGKPWAPNFFAREMGECLKNLNTFMALGEGYFFPLLWEETGIFVQISEKNIIF